MPDKLEVIANRASALESRLAQMERREHAPSSAGALKIHFVPLTTALVSGAWDGSSHATTAKTLIDLSTVFGVPAEIKAVLMNVWVKDSGAAANNCYIVLSPINTADKGQICAAFPANDRWSYYEVIVPCNANGDIYYQIQASGAKNFNVYLQVHGYWELS